MVSSPPTRVANQSRPLLGIGLKVLSVGVFLAMASLLKAAKGIPPGEMVFFRSLFALVPIVAFLAWRRELYTGTRTSRPGGHLLRGGIGVFGQGLGFYALTQLPLAEVTAIQYTLPLLTVVAGALFLGENVRAYRWSAVILGMVGVAIIIWPRLTVFGGGEVIDGTHPGWGAISALTGCVFAAIAYVQVRRLVATERSSTIVLYYSLMCALLALLTFPFGWVLPDPATFLMLVFAGIFGGIGQVTLTESFRQADMSVVAPFEYVSLIFALIVGYVIFGDVPTLPMLLGSAILIGAGVFVIYREHQLGLARARDAATP
ncbi:MAG TPA: DMT family transporter [Devosia sp.]|nr:DMT family transporter [Devosia sp.]